MSLLQRTLLPALLLASAACGDVLFFEVEQPEVCKTLPEQVFAGAQTSLTLTVDISQELQGLGVQSPDGVRPYVSLTRARFVARSGITDFDFVDEAHITLLAPEGSDLAPLRVVDYTRSGATGPVLELPSTGEVDLAGYISQQTIRVEAALTGRLPPEEWRMDVEVCLYGRARVSYLELGGG